jgi:creatinine amidohydrolase
MENFPWTRVPGVVQPQGQKPMVDFNRLQRLDPGARKVMLGDGNYGGVYERSDAEMMALWDVAVEETRDLIASDWA